MSKPSDPATRVFAMKGQDSTPAFKWPTSFKSAAMRDSNTGISYKILRVEEAQPEHHRTKASLEEGFFYFTGRTDKLLFERKINFLTLLQVINRFGRNNGEDWRISEA